MEENAKSFYSDTEYRETEEKKDLPIEEIITEGNLKIKVNSNIYWVLFHKGSAKAPCRALCGIWEDTDYSLCFEDHVVLVFLFAYVSKTSIL